MAKSRCVCVRKAFASVCKLPRVSRVFGSRKSSRNAELSSLLDSRWVAASQKSQQSQDRWSRNAELSSLLDSRWVFTSQKCQQSQGSGGVVAAKTQHCPHFWIGMGLHVSKVRTVRGIGGFEVAKRRTVDSRPKRRTVLPLDLCFVLKKKRREEKEEREQRGEERREEMEDRGEERERREEAQAILAQAILAQATTTSSPPPHSVSPCRQLSLSDSVRTGCRDRVFSTKPVRVSNRAPGQDRPTTRLQLRFSGNQPLPDRSTSASGAARLPYQHHLCNLFDLILRPNTAGR